MRHGREWAGVRRKRSSTKCVIPISAQIGGFILVLAGKTRFFAEMPVARRQKSFTSSHFKYAYSVTGSILEIQMYVIELF